MYCTTVGGRCGCCSFSSAMCCSVLLPSILLAGTSSSSSDYDSWQISTCSFGRLVFSEAFLQTA